MRSVYKLFFVLAIIGLFTIKPRVASWNDASRMATVQSLVEEHSFIIDKSVFVRTGDKVKINGHFYSDKVPMPAVIGAIVYLPLYYSGLKLGYGRNVAYCLITLLTVKLFWLLGLAAFYQVLGFTRISERHRLWLTFALGIASLYFTWSATFNNHILAASFLVIGFYFMLRARRRESVARDLFCGAFFLSLAGTGDIPMAAFYVGFAFYVLFNPRLRGKVIFYVLPLLLTALPALFFNYHIHGSVMPVTIYKPYWEYPGTGINKPAGTNVNQPLLFLYFTLTYLFGPKGFIVYNPLLLLALPCIVGEIKNKRPFRWEALVIGIASLTIMLYYFTMTNNYGGWCYSIRWFVGMLPLLFFFMYSFFENFSVVRCRIFLLLFVVSVLVAAIGLVNPWSNLRLSEIPIIANIAELLIRLLY